ncbi:uncharacterized protein K460DRAFT_281884 [Cucurbitaria berberidis CBS 394.84]|uniref:Uncharacterized protein n=1 Tax=Cucurbitaria berberidis CBS 394.84 TaxID=1168544 RepID=A0A9P4GJ05_9PLEO|nr:uncharacterized protein K460DRAFT_281884 [Cucurbitaria berberidis CBS 394.84]KAF1846099.1 hypothetical protein K460DRAFT_281884 [Cucurbitaria berberidis CBS 394.84]
MVHHVFSLHKITSADNLTFPLSIEDYQRYVFGDDKLAHRLGTDLAKAFIAHGPGNQLPTDDVTVAVLSGYVPTATHSLRNHFVAYLNRHLISINARPALKIDVHGVEEDSQTRKGAQTSSIEAYHVDRKRLESRTIVVLADIRMSQEQEDRINQSLQNLRIDNQVIFAYLVSLDGPPNPVALLPILSRVVSPSIKDAESIAQADQFTMNQCYVQSTLGRDRVEFCQFVRRQDDYFVRLLLDYAIGGSFHKDELFEQNVNFLLWEIGVRESL